MKVQEKLYRIGHYTITLQGHEEICLKLIKFYLVVHKNLFSAFAICDAYQCILDNDGCQLHQHNDTIPSFFRHALV